jgi:hypothetical protein
MLHFPEQLAGVGFSFNAFLMIAALFQIAISFWCFAVDSTSNNNRRIFKWQCLLTTFAAALCLCFGTGVIKLTQDGTFFQFFSVLAQLRPLRKKKPRKKLNF